MFVTGLNISGKLSNYAILGRIEVHNTNIN